MTWLKKEDFFPLKIFNTDFEGENDISIRNIKIGAMIETDTYFGTLKLKGSISIFKLKLVYLA